MNNELKCVSGRVVIKVDREGKNFHTFGDGTKIRLERDYDNLDKRYTWPVQGAVIDSDKIKSGSIVLFEHNGTHPQNEIYNYLPLSGKEIASDFRYFSLREEDCYLWTDPEVENYKPLPGWITCLRIFKPYDGTMQNIAPKKVANFVYVTSGEYSGQVVMTKKASDYEVIYQGSDGREKRVIRIKHFENGEEADKPYSRWLDEVVAVHHEYTGQVNNGVLLIGHDSGNAKTITEYGIG